MDKTKKMDKDLRIADIFDVVAGTSTGSIIALGLTVSDEADNLRPKYPASKVVEIYEKEKDRIFSPIFYPLRLFYAKYKPKNLEALLKENFSRKNNEVCTLNNIVKNVHVLVPSYNITKKEQVYFHNYPKYREHDYTSFSIPDVIRASTAAPTYFPAKEISKNHYVDGGVFMNNPSYFAYCDAKRILQANEYVIFSLGTGSYQEELDQLVDGGPMYWVRPIISLTMNASSNLVEEYFNNDNPDVDINRLHVDYQYFPIRPKLDRDTSLEDTSPESMKNLRRVAEKIIEEKDGEFVNPIFNNLVKKILNEWEPKNY